MDFRTQGGETITGESWLMRNLWDVTTPSGGPRGLATVPKKLKHTGVKSLIERALRAQGIRTKMEDGKKRHPFQTDHGFRKYFKTRCELGGMMSINIEGLMNHSTGVSDSYYRPKEKEILEDYLKAAKSLTISENKDDRVMEKIPGESQYTELQNKHNQEISNLRSYMDDKIEKLMIKLDLKKLV